MNISSFTNPSTNLFCRESHPVKTECYVVITLDLLKHEVFLPLHIIGVALLGFAFWWKVHEYRSWIEPQLKENICQILQEKVKKQLNENPAHVTRVSLSTSFVSQPVENKTFVLTALKTSGPSSKSTMAKNNLLEYCCEYLQELARIWYSLLASLQKKNKPQLSN